MKPIIKYLTETYEISEERAIELCEKHEVKEGDDPFAAGEVIAEEEALEPQEYDPTEEDIAFERPEE